MSNNQTPANSNESTVNILVDRIRNTKLYKYFSTDTASKIALITAIITAGSFVIRLLNYLYWKGYLSIFSFNLGYVDFSINQGFQEFLLHAIVFIGLAVATSLSYLVIDYLWSQYNLIYHKYKLKLHLIIWHSIKGTIKGLPLPCFRIRKH